MKFSDDQKAKIKEYRKCANLKNGFLFFINNFGTIQDRKTEKPIPFKLWPAQVSAVEYILKYILLIILKARQLGLTWLVVHYVVWRAIFNYNELIIIISGDNETYAVEFLDRVKFVFDNLPDRFKPKVMKRNETTLAFGEEVTDKKTGITKIKGLKSVIKSLPPTASAGQSKTVSLLVLDEAALNRYVKKIYAAAAPTLEHAAGRCIVISNPNKDKPGWGWVRDIYTGSMAGLNRFARLFLDPFGVPTRGPNFIQEQLDAGLDEEDRIRMYPLTEEEAISAATGSYFGQVLARHNSFEPGVKGFLLPENADPKCSDGKFEEDQKKGIMTIWEYPYDMQEGWDGIGWSKRYAIGSDVSEGLGGDDSTLYVMDRLTNRVVAKVASNRIDADEWARVTWLVANYYHSNGKPTLSCTERNGAGQTTVKRLYKLGAPQYVKVVPDTEGKGYTKQIGWTQTQQSKHELMGDFKAYLRATDQPIWDGRLIDQCSTFIRHDNGRLGHEDMKNDDDVFGAALALQASYFIGEPPARAGVSEKAVAERKALIDEVGGTTAQAMKERDRIFKSYDTDYEEDDDNGEDESNW
ncbi:MAG: terminase family protein [Desulfobacteraceae bacterium]|nr:terminase family protein [Desulfobacteraceae bacterium]